MDGASGGGEGDESDAYRERAADAQPLQGEAAVKLRDMLRMVINTHRKTQTEKPNRSHSTFFAYLATCNPDGSVRLGGSRSENTVWSSKKKKAERLNAVKELKNALLTQNGHGGLTGRARTEMLETLFIQLRTDVEGSWTKGSSSGKAQGAKMAEEMA